MTLLSVNTLFLLHLLITLSELPTISINNNLYDDYYLTVFINKSKKNSTEETEFLSCAFAKFDISDLNKLILGDDTKNNSANESQAEHESANLLNKQK